MGDGALGNSASLPEDVERGLMGERGRHEVPAGGSHGGSKKGLSGSDGLVPLPAGALQKFRNSEIPNLKFQKFRKSRNLKFRNSEIQL